MFLETKTKLKQALAVVLNCYKLEIAFECQTVTFPFFSFQRPNTQRSYI